MTDITEAPNQRPSCPPRLLTTVVSVTLSYASNSVSNQQGNRYKTNVYVDNNILYTAITL